jgi:hypothetical protein
VEATSSPFAGKNRRLYGRLLNAEEDLQAALDEVEGPGVALNQRNRRQNQSSRR